MLLVWLIVALVNSNSQTRPQNYQQQVMSIVETERQNPARFLTVEGTYRTNFWGDKMVVEGTINNVATVANYKDVVVTVYFMSETDTELSRENYVIYKRFPAHGKTPFELRVPRPDACKKVNLDVLRATPD